MNNSAQVLAHFENRQVEPTAFKHNDNNYLVKRILKTTEVENPFFTISQIKDRVYWVIAQDGTRAVLHWHRNTGEWTIERIVPAK